MTNKMFVSVICAASLLFATGCKTITSSQLNQAQAILNATVPIAVEYAILKDAKSLPYLVAAADLIDVAASTGNVFPATIVVDLRALGVKELKSLEAELAIMGGIGIYEVFFAQTVTGDANTTILLRTLATDIRRGFPLVTAKSNFKSKIKRQ